MGFVVKTTIKSRLRGAHCLLWLVRLCERRLDCPITDCAQECHQPIMLQEARLESVHAAEDGEICSPERYIRLTLDNVDVWKPQCSHYQIIRNALCSVYIPAAFSFLGLLYMVKNYCDKAVKMQNKLCIDK